MGVANSPKESGPRAILYPSSVVGHPFAASRRIYTANKDQRSATVARSIFHAHDGILIGGYGYADTDFPFAIRYPLVPMATESKMLALGTKAPAFRLPDYKGRIVSIDDFAASPALLVAFICNHCPYVKHIRHEFARFAREYHPRGLAVVGIAANDIDTYPQDGPAGMEEEARSAGYTFPYLFDETQKVAHAYLAACTPDFFLFDRARELVYRGQFDNSRPGSNIPVTGADMRAACDAVLADKPVTTEQRPSIGCSIKWKR